MAAEDGSSAWSSGRTFFREKEIERRDTRRRNEEERIKQKKKKRRRKESAEEENFFLKKINYILFLNEGYYGYFL